MKNTKKNLVFSVHLYDALCVQTAQPMYE